MKTKILFSFVVIILIINTLSAQTRFTLHHYSYWKWYESELGVDTTKFRATNTISTFHDLNERWFVSAFALVSYNWGEVLFGLGYKPAPWISFELQAGVETKNQALRGAAVLWMQKGSFTFDGVYEYGKSFEWYNVTLFHTFKKGSKAGIFLSQYKGIGPRFDIKLGKLPFWTWGTYVYDWETNGNGFVVGIYSRFKTTPAQQRSM